MKFLEFYIMFKEADSFTGALFVALAEMVYSGVMLAVKMAVSLTIIRLVWVNLPQETTSFFFSLVHLAFTR